MDWQEAVKVLFEALKVFLSYLAQLVDLFYHMSAAKAVLLFLIVAALGFLIWFCVKSRAALRTGLAGVAAAVIVYQHASPVVGLVGFIIVWFLLKLLI